MITLDILKEYLNVTENTDDVLLELILNASVDYVKKFTGETDEGILDNKSIQIAIMVLASEMYDNRSYSMSESKTNAVIESILSMHSVNLI